MFEQQPYTLGLSQGLSQGLSHALVAFWVGITRPVAACLLLVLLSSVNIKVWARDAIYVSDATPVDQLTVNQLRSLLFLHKRSWQDGSRVVILVPRLDSQEFTEFVKSTVGLFPYQLRRHWERASFSGQSSPPLFFESNHELIEALKETPGAIGVLPDNINERELKRVALQP